MSKLQQLAFELEEELNKVVEAAIPPSDYSEIKKMFIKYGWIMSDKDVNNIMVLSLLDDLFEGYYSYRSKNTKLSLDNERLRDELYGPAEEGDSPPEEATNNTLEDFLVPPPAPQVNQQALNNAILSIQQMQAEMNNAVAWDLTGVQGNANTTNQTDPGDWTGN